MQTICALEEKNIKWFCSIEVALEGIVIYMDICGWFKCWNLSQIFRDFNFLNGFFQWKVLLIVRVGKLQKRGKIQYSQGIEVPYGFFLSQSNRQLKKSKSKPGASSSKEKLLPMKYYFGINMEWVGGGLNVWNLLCFLEWWPKGFCPPHLVLWSHHEL